MAEGPCRVRGGWTASSEVIERAARPAWCWWSAPRRRRSPRTISEAVPIDGEGGCQGPPGQVAGAPGAVRPARSRMGVRRVGGPTSAGRGRVRRPSPYRHPVPEIIGASFQSGRPSRCMGSGHSGPVIPARPVGADDLRETTMSRRTRGSVLGAPGGRDISCRQVGERPPSGSPWLQEFSPPGGRSVTSVCMYRRRQPAGPLVGPGLSPRSGDDGKSPPQRCRRPTRARTGRTPQDHTDAGHDALAHRPRSGRAGWSGPVPRPFGGIVTGARQRRPPVRPGVLAVAGAARAG